MRKLSSVVLIVMLLLTQFDIPSAKADVSSYEFDNGTITGYKGIPPANLVIPDAIDETAVLGIADHVFANKQLTFVHIPWTIESIGEGAFADNHLRMVRFDWLDESVTIGAGAFDNQEISDGFNGWFMDPELTIPWNGLAGDFSIYSATPATYTVSFESNGGSKFAPRSFTENDFIDIWERPEKPGLAFVGWYKDQGLVNKLDFLDIITEDMTLYAKWDNPFQVVTNKDDTLSIVGYRGDPPQDLVIPEEIDGFIVTRISYNAFERKNLQSVTLPSTLEQIADFAFRENQLSNLIVTDKVKSIGQFAFSNNNLQTVTLPSILEGIDDYAFSGNQLKNVVIPDKVEYIGFAAFADNALTSLTISDGVQYIGSYAFQENNLTTLHIPDSVLGIGIFAFEDNKLADLRLSNNMTKIDSSSFSNNNLKEVTIPNSVTYIDEFAFSNNKLVSVTLPEGVTHIEALAFSENQLTSITLPDSVEYIGIGAFTDNKLTNIVIPEKVTIIEDSAFEKNKLISITLPEGITEIKGLAFSRNELTSIQIPSTVTHIGERAFERNKLTNLSIPNSVIFIGEWAFSNNQLTSVHIPDGITKIADYTFITNKLMGITLPESVTQIGEFAFDGNNLTNLIIPKNVTSIGQGAFYENKLNKVVFQGAVNTIGVAAFEDQKLSNPKFKGWFTDYALTERWDENVPQMMTIYSVAPTTYTVLFETNGGSPIAAKTIADGEKLPMVETPTKKDFVFAGWYKEPAFQAAWNFETEIVTENITLYAKWDVNSPMPPTDLQTMPGDGEVNLSWTASDPADGYNVYKQEKTEDVTPDAGRWMLVNDAGPVAGTSYSVESLTAGKGYWFAVTAVVEGLESDFSDPTSETSYTTVAEIVTPRTVEVGKGLAPEKLEQLLPEQLQVQLTSLPLQMDAGVAWKVAQSDYNPEQLGTYTVTGILQLPGYIHNPQVKQAEIAVTVLPNTNAQLSGITLNGEPLKDFDPNLYSYDVSFAYATEQVTVTAATYDPAATYEVIGEDVQGGAQPLKVGADNLIKIHVTAEDQQETATYTLHVGRQQDAEAPTWTAGSVLTVSDITQTSMKLIWPAAQDNDAVIGYRLYLNDEKKVDQASNEYEYTVTESVYTYTMIDLTPNSSYRLTVKAFDAAGNVSEPGLSLTAMTLPRSSSGGGWYLSSNANLKTLEIWAEGESISLTPSFKVDTLSYTAKTKAKQMEVKASAEHSAAKVTWQGQVLEDGVQIDLQEGENVIPLIVQAEDGSRTTYKLVIERIVPDVEEPDEPEETPISFTDIAGHWAESYIKRATARGIVSGYPDGTFKPNNIVTRAEFTVMLIGAWQLNEAGAALTFTDADQIGAWAKQSVARAVQSGIVTGYDDGSFRPDAQITRAEMAVMIARVLQLPTENSASTGFADDADIPYWARGAVEAIRQHGVIEGRGGNRFVANETATRAEATVMLFRMLERNK